MSLIDLHVNVETLPESSSRIRPSFTNNVPGHEIVCKVLHYQPQVQLLLVLEHYDTSFLLFSLYFKFLSDLMLS
jgi:hypothetical protein